MIVDALSACERSYREAGGIPAVLDHEQSERFGNDFIDMGFIDDQPWIVVRGSDDAADWIANLFDEYQTELIGRVEGWLMLHRLRGHEITLSGHSRGGALAQYIAKILALQGFKIKTVITFGSPKIENPDSHRGLYRHLRIVNGADSVPTLPPFWYWGTHGHHGETLILARRARWRRWFRISGALTHHGIYIYKKNYLLLKNRRD